MKNYFYKIYLKLALRFYSVGKLEFEKRAEKIMFTRSNTSADTRFYPEAEIVNLANDINKITIGHNCHISGLLLVYNYGGTIKLGNNCSLSPYSRIISAKGITIGDRVLIAHNVNIIDNISHPIDASSRHDDFMTSYTTGMQERDIKAEEIIIEDDVWIGFNSAILRGVTIGKGAIIGSGSVVTKNVKAWTVNVGNPLRIVRDLKPVHI